MEFDIVTAFPPMIEGPLSYSILILSGQRQHLLIEVHSDDLAALADDLGDDVTGLAAPGPDIENGLPFPDVLRRVSTPVVLPDDLVGDHFQERSVVANRDA